MFLEQTSVRSPKDPGRLSCEVHASDSKIGVQSNCFVQPFGAVAAMTRVAEGSTHR
jgi:hypothetical protein